MIFCFFSYAVKSNLHLNDCLWWLEITYVLRLSNTELTGSCYIATPMRMFFSFKLSQAICSSLPSKQSTSSIDLADKFSNLICISIHGGRAASFRREQWLLASLLYKYSLAPSFMQLVPSTRKNQSCRSGEIGQMADWPWTDSCWTRCRCRRRRLWQSMSSL